MKDRKRKAENCKKNIIRIKKSRKEKERQKIKKEGWKISGEKEK